MTEMVHGQAALDDAVRASEALFSKELSGLSDEELTAVFSDVPSVTVERSALGSGLRLTQLLVRAGACPSRGEANRLVQGGGVYLNNRRVDVDARSPNPTWPRSRCWSCAPARRVTIWSGSRSECGVVNPARSRLSGGFRNCTRVRTPAESRQRPGLTAPQ